MNINPIKEKILDTKKGLIVNSPMMAQMDDTIYDFLLKINIPPIIGKIDKNISMVANAVRKCCNCSTLIFKPSCWMRCAIVSISKEKM